MPDEGNGSMTNDRGYPAYYVRYSERFVSWFCMPQEAGRFLDAGVENGHFAAIGTAPEPGKKYKDHGHEDCWDDRHWRPSVDERAVLAAFNSQQCSQPLHVVLAGIEISSPDTEAELSRLKRLERWHARMYRAVAVLLERGLINLSVANRPVFPDKFVITEAGRAVLAVVADEA